MIPLLLQLPSALAQEDIRPLKPAMEVHDPVAIGPWLVAALALMALAYGAWRWWRRPELSPEERLRRGLASAARAFDEGRTGDGVDEALDAIRGFLHDTTDIPARYLTDDELLGRLQGRLPDALHQQIEATLTAWDRLRFAGADLDEAAVPAWIDPLVEALAAPDEDPADAHTNAQPRAAS